jgi:hypothetical protein
VLKCIVILNVSLRTTQPVDFNPKPFVFFWHILFEDNYIWTVMWFFQLLSVQVDCYN